MKNIVLIFSKLKNPLRQKVFISLLFAASIFLFLANSKISAANNPSVLIIGDSITVRAQPYEEKLLSNTHIDGQVSRAWQAGIDILNNLKNKGQLNEDIVVFALGTNGGASSQDVENLLNIVGDKKVVLVTIYGTQSNLYYMNNTNQVFKDEANKHSTITIADWYALASKHPDWIENADPFVHPTIPTGSEHYAQLIADTVNNAGSSSNSNSNPNSSGNVTSNEVLTCVGNVSSADQKACQNQSNQGPSNSKFPLVRTGTDLAKAYIACPYPPGPNGPGSTVVGAQRAMCVGKQLIKMGYDSGRVNAVKGASNTFEEFSAAGCVQCIGFVRQAAILAYGTDQPALENVDGGTDGSLSSFDVGSHHFVPDSMPNAGDIGFIPISNDPPAGHIFIVVSVNGTHFNAVESNWGYPIGINCTAGIHDHFAQPGSDYYTYYKDSTPGN